MNLRTALRDYWQATELMFKAKKSGRADVMEIRAKELELAREHALAVQERTPIIIVSEPDAGEPFSIFTKEHIDALLDWKLVYECELCEEDDSVAIDYDGADHREFHPTGDHTIGCLVAALHSAGYDGDWPFSDICERCAS